MHLAVWWIYMSILEKDGSIGDWVQCDFSAGTKERITWSEHDWKEIRNLFRAIKVQYFNSESCRKHNVKSA